MNTEEIKQCRQNLSQLSNDLRKEGQTRKQNFSCLASMTSGSIRDYCALGVLGCAKKMIYTKWDEFSQEVDLIEPREEQIINLYGLSNELKTPFIVSYKTPNHFDDKAEDIIEQQKHANIRNTKVTTLNRVITNLNDGAHYSFNQIADVLDFIANNAEQYLSLATESQIEEAQAVVNERAEQEAQRALEMQQKLLEKLSKK